MDFRTELSAEVVEKILTGFKTQKKKEKKEDIPDEEITLRIDHTILKPEATDDEIIQLCKEADQYKFASVCVNPSYVKLCADHLNNSPVKVCTVIGFPLGATNTEVKRYEAELAIENGAEEIDMVINIGRLKNENYEYVFNDISQVVSVTKKNNAILKVIIETALLNDQEKIKACLICKKAGADFVKTSTGFSKGGAEVEDVALMKFVVGENLKVKASGGIRTKEGAVAMIVHGADRIGTSSGVKIIT